MPGIAEVIGLTLGMFGALVLVIPDFFEKCFGSCFKKMNLKESKFIWKNMLFVKISIKIY